MKRMGGILLAVTVLVLIVAPVQAQQYKWRMPTFGSETSSYFVLMAQPFAKLVKELTDGKVDITVYPAGVLAPIFKIHEAVNDGLVEVAHVPPVFLGTKDPTNAIITQYPGGLGTDALLAWEYYGGGYELLQQHRREVLKLHSMLVGAGPTEFFAHSHVPIRKVQDLKNLKYRTLGNNAAIVKDFFGASPTVVPFTELYSMLEKKSIDLLEFSTPSDNMDMAFHEVAKYIIYPGIQAPCYAFEVVMTLDRWNSLPKDIQRKLEIAAKTVTMDSLLAGQHKDLLTMQKLEKGKNEWIKLDEQFQAEFRKAARKWMWDRAAEEKAKGNLWPEKIAKSYFDFQDFWEKYSKYMSVNYRP
jgi:TRAP-type mannitol/chloroaromatic compound transport system substrate-binding protein